MNDTEELVMSLWDKGSSIEAIAKRTGFKRKHVYRIVHRFVANDDDFDLSAIRRGSSMLLSAIIAAHAA